MKIVQLEIIFGQSEQIQRQRSIRFSTRFVNYPQNRSDRRTNVRKTFRFHFRQRINRRTVVAWRKKFFLSFLPFLIAKENVRILFVDRFRDDTHLCQAKRFVTVSDTDTFRLDSFRRSNPKMHWIAWWNFVMSSLISSSVLMIVLWVKSLLLEREDCIIRLGKVENLTVNAELCFALLVDWLEFLFESCETTGYSKECRYLSLNAGRFSRS